jgi:hypothetical protein
VHFQLSSEQATAARSALGALQGDPRVSSGDPMQAAQAISEQEDSMVRQGVPKPLAALHAAPLYLAAGHAPEQLPQLINNIVKTASGPQGTVAANTPNLTDTGGALMDVGPFSNQGTHPTLIQKTLPPTTPTVRQGPNGTYEPGYVGNTFGGGNVASGPPQYNPVDAPRVQANAQQIQQIRTALGDPQFGIPIQHQINSTLLQLIADPDSKTGVSADKQARFEGLIANTPLIGKLFTDKGTTNYDELNAYLDRQLLASASTLGGGANTDAARNLVGGAVGSPAMTKEALAEKIKFNDALAAATEAFGRGLDKAVGTGVNQNPAALDSYRSAWTANNDPVVFRLNQAKSRGDTEDYNKTLAQIKSMTPAQRALTLTHAKNINNLTTTGQVAQ